MNNTNSEQTAKAADERTKERNPILAIEEMETHYPVREGWLRREVGRIRAVDGVSFTLNTGEALGLVGESGSGKSTVARTILGLEEITEGTVTFDGTPLSELDGEALQSFRRRVQLVVQDPDEAFNPRMTVGEAVAEPLRLHGIDDSDRRRSIATDLLERVGLSATDADRYPHEFSGGEKQRIAIARALVVNPDVIIADEPTSALDSRVRSDVLALLAEIQADHDVAVLFISHDIDVVRLFCDRIAVMYAGELVEKGPAERIVTEPAHPYTRVLLGSVPSLDPADQSLARPLTDEVPDPMEPPSGCRFHPRCPEIIPPEEFDVSQDTWQSVAELRFTLQTGELSDTLTGEGVSEQAVREEFGLPATMQDEDLEKALGDAISAVRSGDIERAGDLLATATPTVCERQSPGGHDVDGRLVSCHRYDPESSATPLAWSENS